MPNVRIDNSFFKKERAQAYSDWESAFWRELFQNSIDQDASQIDITIEPPEFPMGPIKVTFTDDGPGMTQETLERVYFAIGATTKTGPDSIGGMGRARILTCFAMISYRIDSQDYYVEGRGGEYQVFKSPSYFNGCKLTIEVDESNVASMTEKLNDFLSESHFSAFVRLNGERIQWKKAYAGRFNRHLLVPNEDSSLPFANVHVNKSAANHRLIVRVKGVSMFSTEIEAKAQVVVELFPELSRLALTANRDGLRGDYRRALYSFLHELAVDTQSVIKDRFKRHTTVVDGGGMQTVVPVKPKSKKRATEVIEAVVEQIQERCQERYSTVPGTETVSHQEIVRWDDFGSWLRRTFGDIFIYDESDLPKVHKVVPNYLPDNWKLMTVNGKSIRKGGNIIKVLLMWKVAVQYAAEITLGILGMNSLDYSVGFVFKEETLAIHRDHNGGHIFCVHPVDADGKLKFSVRERASLKRLMTYAKHEATHINRRWHDEEFSSLREAIDCVFDETECLRRMKTALDAVPSFGEEEWKVAA